MSTIHRSPWHAGEVQLQARHGVAERMAEVGARVIRDHMPDQHRTFYAQLPFLVLGAVDDAGDPWATLVEGEPGFVHSPDPRTLRVDALPDPDDPASAGLTVGAALGCLGIELPTRRRNRVNGRVRGRDDAGFTVAAEWSFGNCPQYIQTRTPVEVVREAAPAEPMTGLDEAARLAITTADTFFVASYVDEDGDPARRGVDVSHRGGRPGFVRVDGEVLTIPDFAGNLFFNTLGNLLVNPRAGLVFVDFARGHLLQISGPTELVLAGEELAQVAGAERLWRVRAQQVVRRRGALASRWRFEQFSPRSLATGAWGRDNVGTP
ncbi:pyridoxamine 5'-phosphate oxidase family protein [Nannocystis sp. ILAH1]|uniref:pyridoxamine 5'-phosphate oxidase family protein n=1 Tax=Nannocystis sp. ILAH1 TaxID=2996789 RepID=UPI002270A966|nr:pyridoxamine 5'-phosphate oxidase family protein [Nannocystis sp. ILAH1]MCY0986543.1 pyridoxamine 5'-phosphate oxidase family protein [Nannocystis sp. ILAH1]